MDIIKYKTLLDDRGLPGLVAERKLKYEADDKALCSPGAAAQMLMDAFLLHQQTEEFLYEICLDTKLKLIGVFEISHGTIDRAVVSPREIFQKALFCGASRIIVAHNHPSGDLTPSRNDIVFSKKLDEAGEIIDIKVADSLIITKGGYLSLSREGDF